MRTRMVGLNIKPWCTCIETGTFHQKDGYTKDLSSGIWVHPRCRKPTKMNYDRMRNRLPQIPQVKRPEDIYEIERRYESNQVVKAELGWDDDDDEEDEYDWND